MPLKIDTSINLPTLLAVVGTASGIIYNAARYDAELSELKRDSANNKAEHREISMTLQTAVDGQHRLAIVVERISATLEERTRKVAN